MTRNKAMTLSAFVGAVITGITGGLTLGLAGAALGGLGAAAVGFPLLFHDAPVRSTKPDERGQVADEEDPQ